MENLHSNIQLQTAHLAQTNSIIRLMTCEQDLVLAHNFLRQSLKKKNLFLDYYMFLELFEYKHSKTKNYLLGEFQFHPTKKYEELVSLISYRFEAVQMNHSGRLIGEKVLSVNYFDSLQENTPKNFQKILNEVSIDEACMCVQYRTDLIFREILQWQTQNRTSEFLGNLFNQLNRKI